MFTRSDILPRAVLPKKKKDIYPEDTSISIPGIDIGDYKFSASIQDASGWMICDGRALSRSEYRRLFRKIGTAFGDAGSDYMFNLPDCKGRVMAAIGSQSEIRIDPNVMGKSVGEETHTLTTSELPAHSHAGVTGSGGSHTHTASTGLNGQHTHGIVDSGHAHTQFTYNDDFNNEGGAAPSFTADSGGVRTWTNINTAVTGISLDESGGHTHTVTVNSVGNHTHEFQTNDVGDSQSHNNMQPTVFIGNMFIFTGVRTRQCIL